VCSTNKSDILSLHYVIDNSFRKTFNATSQAVYDVYEFGRLIVNDVINMNKKKNIVVKYGLSDNLPCYMCK